ncbi:MAG: phage major capsid protein [Roseiflexus sp.]|jgi:HK97 family phage major capsid protein|nr:phage major capsid protein [Roseiflexus sp.]
MNTKILGWMHERQAKLQMARAILDGAEAENRGLNEDEEKRYSDLLAAVDGLQTKIEREQDLERRENALSEPVRAPIRPSETMIDMDKSDVRRYSLVRAINALATGDWRNARLELEASQAVAKRLGFEPQGLFVPYDWLAANAERRDLVKGTNTAGGYTVATDLLAQDFIDLLRNRVVVIGAGATVLDGLVGDIAIPRQTAASTAYWVAENGAPTESQPAFDQVAMTPKTLGGYVDISRKLLLQSALSVEAFVRTDLARVLGIEIDRAALHGTATNNQPRGVAATSGIGAVVGGTNGAEPTWAHIVALETEVAVDNADVGALRYVTNPKVRGKLKMTEKAPNTGQFVWSDGDNPLNGYPVSVSSQVASNLDKGTSTGVCSAIFFGNWNDLIIGMWGTLDLLVDPYSLGTTGARRVIALQDVDVAVRHPQSFAVMLDALTN